MTGASIETTLELWASSLRDVKSRMRGLFTQERVAASANLFLDGLLGDERRKTGWMRAEAAGDPGPWRQQAILGRGRWDADGLRDIVRDYVVENLAANDAVLVIDETGFLKQSLPRRRPGARHLAASLANTLVRRARSRTARSVCSPPMCLLAAMPLSIALCICPRSGPAILRGLPQPTCLKPQPSPPSQRSLFT